MKPEQSQLPEELQQFQSEIELLINADFSKGNAARQRVQRRLEEQWRSDSWWSWLRRITFSDLQTRVAVASTALLLFGILNMNGMFSMPQHSLFVAPVPILPAQVMHLTDDVTTGTLRPSSLLAKMTPEIAPQNPVSLPTPMPVPVPLIEEQN